MTTETPKLYRVGVGHLKADGYMTDYAAVRIRDKRRVFYGTRREVEEWIERNGHDEDV
jgi:hypothetical protein